MRYSSKLNRAIASAVLAGCFALAGPGLASAQDGGKAKAKAKGWSYDPAYVSPEPDTKMLKAICVAQLRSEIAKVYGLSENLALTRDLKRTDFVGDPSSCPPLVEECPDCAPEESFEVIVVE